MWEESLVFAESYRRLLAPEALVLFELVDVATALSRKEARKVRNTTPPIHPLTTSMEVRTQQRVFVRSFFGYLVVVVAP